MRRGVMNAIRGAVNSVALRSGARSVRRAVAMAGLVSLSCLPGCAADGSNDRAAGDRNGLANVRETDARDESNARGDNAMPPHGPAYLITPEQQDDLTVLSASALTARLTQARAQVNDLTGRAFAYRLDHPADNIENDAAYQKLLREMKTAETELFRLERERDRRAEQATR